MYKSTQVIPWTIAKQLPPVPIIHEGHALPQPEKGTLRLLIKWANQLDT
jgi:hypothetical protein